MLSILMKGRSAFNLGERKRGEVRRFPDFVFYTRCTCFIVVGTVQSGVPGFRGSVETVILLENSC